MNKAKCEFCGEEFEAERSTAKFCSTNCRVGSSRQENVSTDFSKYTAEDLYNGISTYKEDKWIDSPEHEELMRRLKELSIEELEEQGFKIPNWKRMEGKEIEI